MLITDHSYAPDFDFSANSGQYCVQFMTFYREGEVVRKWWEEKCIEWCFARAEDGKFGDQKYLDDWPERFAEYVHVLNNKELLLAPWNAKRFPYGNSICWHFHALRIITIKSNNKFMIDYGHYPLPKVSIQNIYEKYVEDLLQSFEMIQKVGGKIKSQKTRSLKEEIKKILHGTTGNQKVIYVEPIV